MRKLLCIISMILMLTTFAYGQTVHIYNRTPGASVTFAWTLVANQSYNFKIVKVDGSVVDSGKVTTGSVTKTLSTVGVYRFEVQAEAISDGKTLQSTWSRSDDPVVALVDGVAKGWLVDVAAPVIPPPPAPSGIKITN